METLCPELDLIQECPAGSLDTTITAAVSILCALCTAECGEGKRFSCWNLVSDPSSKAEML